MMEIDKKVIINTIKALPKPYDYEVLNELIDKLYEAVQLKESRYNW